MKKFSLLFASVLLALFVSAQNYPFPEAVQEYLQQEQLDLTENYDNFETNLSEENYYYETTSRGEITDTIIGYKWDKQNEVWKNWSLVIKFYDENDNVIEKIFHHWRHQDSLWVNGLNYHYVYNENNRLIEKTIQYWNRWDEVWVNHFKLTIDYENDNPVQKLSQFWSFNQEEWMNKHLKLITWDNDLRIADTVKRWKPFNSTWCNKVMHEFYYEENLLTERITYFWKHNSGEWKNKKKALFTYDETGELYEIIFQFWFHGNNQIEPFWANHKRIEFIYEEENLAELLRQYWKKYDSTWVDYKLNEYTYDELDNLIEALIKVKHQFDSTLVNNTFITFTYDENGNLVQKLLQKWNRMEEIWVNCRLWEILIGEPEMFTSINSYKNQQDVSATFINPYPVNSPITFTGLDDGTYLFSLIDFTGKELIQRQIIAGETIRISESLPSGLYIITLSQNDNLIKSDKLIIAR